MRLFLLALTLFVFPGTLHADWNRPPTNINHTTYNQDIHAVRGHDGLARIGNTLFAVTPYHSGGRVEVWKSIDDGDTWTSLGYHFTVESCSLIRGGDDHVYLFGRYHNALTMTRFDENSTSLPAAVNISPIGDYNYGSYVTVTATVDEQGRLYVTSHQRSSTYPSRDDIVQTVSSDNGTTWSPLLTLKSADNNDGWYNANCAVSTDNDIHCVMGSFQENPREIRVMRSTNHGQSYGDEVLLYSGVMANPHILTKGENEVFVFAQSEDDPVPGRGLVMNHSMDSGRTWSGWKLIDRTCNYADPSAALTSDGRIIIAMRRDNATGTVGTLCGDSCRQAILQSTDNGNTWTVEQYLDNGYERVGTQSKLRYQTWHSGGGILEWIWMQETDNGSHTPIYYSNNQEITIRSTDTDTPAPSRPAPPTGFTLSILK